MFVNRNKSGYFKTTPNISNRWRGSCCCDGPYNRQIPRNHLATRFFNLFFFSLKTVDGRNYTIFPKLRFLINGIDI